MAIRLEMGTISKRFLGVQALADVSLSVDAGQILALVGENGAGKSTLIKILSGAQRPDSGQILIDGREVHLESPRAAVPYGIATIYQELNLFPALSVTENLLFGRYPRRAGTFINWRAARTEARDFLGDLGLHVDVDAMVGQLSLANRQMLEIAKALHQNVRILVLDEPTAVLGDDDVEHLKNMVHTLRDHGVAIIFISHRLSEIFGFADQFVVLRDGHRTGSGTVADIDEDRLVSMMVGRSLADVARKPRTPTSEVVLQAEGITRRGILADISLKLHRGEVLGIAGLRGAGRTELARALFGADPIDAGRVSLSGRALFAKTPNQAVKAGLGLVPEDRGSQGLFRDLSTAQNIPVARMVATGSWRASPGADARTADSYVEALRIRLSSTRAPVATLSGGNQQKVVLAKWLEADVSVLILDEPTRGIDVGAKREIYDIVDALCERGVGVLLISSELPELLAMCDRILVMHQGRLAGELGRAEASEEAIMRYAVGGGQSVQER
jgi:ABC-type sugar transport system ATPase subunit